MEKLQELTKGKQVVMVNISDKILISRDDFEEWQKLRMKRQGSWIKSLTEFCNLAPVSQAVMADMLKMPELKKEVEFTKDNPDGWVEYASGKGTSWYFKESKARDWLENDYTKWRLFYLERYKGQH